MYKNGLIVYFYGTGAFGYHNYSNQGDWIT